MRIYDIIHKKRDGGALTDAEITFFVNGYVSGEIPDYQIAALLMAIYFSGMDARETAVLTNCMAKSGDMIDLSEIPGIKVDKHSTGGVGDKTTLIVAPIVAACGVPVAKMSGRGLGHTGGTIDKLESIPGFETSQTRERFFAIVKEHGLSVIGQTGNIAPADKKLYALRDVTATVESLPLIASSVMSKKLASGADAILLDVKTGSGAFMKTLEASIELARAMVDIGEQNGRKTAALVTDMDTPLGFAIGNSLEVIESAEVLKGKGPADLREVSLALAASMLALAGKGTQQECRAMAEAAIASGAAYEKLCSMVTAQGGDRAVLDDPGRFEKAKIICEIKARRDGWISSIEAETCGLAACMLGAGRTKKDDMIDHAAGIVLARKPGDRVQAGDVLATLHTSDERLLESAKEMMERAFHISDDRPAVGKLVYAKVDVSGVAMF